MKQESAALSSRGQNIAARTRSKLFAPITLRVFQKVYESPNTKSSIVFGEPEREPQNKRRRQPQVACVDLSDAFKKVRSMRDGVKTTGQVARKPATD